MDFQSMTINKRSFFITVVFIVYAFAKAYSQSNSSLSTYHDSQINVVDIHLTSSIELDIIESKDEYFKIKESQAGEYKNAIILSAKKQNDTLKIVDPISPSFKFPQDKLSAHKVIDGKATIFIPENTIVIINARSAFLKITGEFKNLYINILSGNCHLNSVVSETQITSVYADIQVNEPKTNVISSSKYGIIHGDTIKNHGVLKMKIETLHGDITIKD